MSDREITVRKVRPDESHYAGQCVPGSAMFLGRYVAEFDDPGYDRFYDKKKAYGFTEKSAIKKARKFLRQYEESYETKTVSLDE